MPSLLSSLDLQCFEVDLTPVCKGNISFFPGPGPAADAAKPLWLAFDIHNTYLADAFFKNGFYCTFDICLGCSRIHPKRIQAFLTCGRDGFFGKMRSQENRKQMFC